MAVFPLFTDLSGKKCIIVGGGEVASRKVDVLLKFDAELVVIAPEVDRSIRELEGRGRVKVLQKEYSEGDIDNAVLVVAATSSFEVNDCVFRDARKRNIPVNTMDDPEKCTFYFPSVIKRGDLTVGISTSGGYPALSKKIRKMLEGIFTVEYARILDMLSDFRYNVQKSLLNRHQREKVLKQVVDELFESGDISCSTLSKILKKYDSQMPDGRQ